jgi:gamma-glutamylcyclotransferase (GGCT)/AIG2-like uncharacterized protein YtfP
VTDPDPASSGTFLLFVYGTLMRGGPRAVVVSGQRFVGEARTREGYALYDLGPYPALVRQAGAGPVHGELLSVATSLRDCLDQIEGAPDLYRLEEVALDGIAGPVYSYLYQRDPGGGTPIKSGRWDNGRAAPLDGGGL